jgi:hypothetical protein
MRLYYHIYIILLSLFWISLSFKEFILRPAHKLENRPLSAVWDFLLNNLH